MEDSQVSFVDGNDFTARLTAPVVTTTTVIFGSNKI